MVVGNFVPPVDGFDLFDENSLQRRADGELVIEFLLGNSFVERC